MATQTLWRKPARDRATWVKRALWAIRKSESVHCKAYPALAREFMAMAREAIAQSRAMATV